jgi:hypothetical protein
MISSPKIIWSLFTVGVLALGLSIYQLNRALDVTEGRVIPPQYVVTSSTPDTIPPTTTPSTRPTTLRVATAIAQSAQWNNKNVCLQGVYQNSFEFTALADASDAKGNLQPPYVWIGVPVDESKLNCDKNQVDQVTCRAQTTICGIFQAAADGDRGYGHVSSFRYQLTEPTQPIKGSLPLQLH